MQKTILTQVILLITSTASSSVFAAAFYNDFQSASAMGNAFVGSGVAGDDISMMFYNPATIALFDEQQFVVAGFYEGTHGEFTVNTATDTFGAPKLDAPGQQYDVLPHQFSGAIYTAMPIDEYFTLGASLTSPYDGYSDYSNSAVENTARQTLLRTYTGNLSLAMEVTEELSLAAGA
ncbi:MAG: outer membrane protein transport protein, partial [Gammaproteobacteria bacterium]